MGVMKYKKKINLKYTDYLAYRYTSNVKKNNATVGVLIKAGSKT